MVAGGPQREQVRDAYWRRTFSELHALPRLALLADHGADPFELARHLGVGGHDSVERIRDLSFKTCPVAGKTHGEIAVSYGLEDAKQLGEGGT